MCYNANSTSGKLENYKKKHNNKLITKQVKTMDRQLNEDIKRTRGNGMVETGGRQRWIENVEGDHCLVVVS